MFTSSSSISNLLMLHLQKLTVMYPAEEPKIKQLAQFIAAVFQVAFLFHLRYL